MKLALKSLRVVAAILLWYRRHILRLRSTILAAPQLSINDEKTGLMENVILTIGLTVYCLF